MKKLSPFIVLTLFSSFAFSCNEVNGKYLSVSESHWEFELKINEDKAQLAYSYTEAGKEFEEISKGYCKKINDGSYQVVFLERSISLRFSPHLSHSSFGKTSSSAGFVGKLFKNKDSEVEVWVLK